MAIKPFEVEHPGPRFLLIVFMGYDNGLPDYLADQHLCEMAQAAGPDVAILAVTDTSSGPGQVFEVTSSRIHLVQNLDEIEMGDAEQLRPLLERALISYSGQPRIAIGFAGHGSGVFGEGRVNPVLKALKRIGRSTAGLLHSLKGRVLGLPEYAAGIDWPNGLLTNEEIGLMLGCAFGSVGRTAPVDLLFFDTCLNGMIEVVTEFAEFASCVVASEENQPGHGWRYDLWLSSMDSAPPLDAAAWGGQAVEAMAAAYAGIRLPYPLTLSAVAAGRHPLPVVERFKDLVDAAWPLGREGFECLNRARINSRIFGDKVDSYDLGKFAGHLAGAAGMPELKAAAEALRKAVEEAVLHRTPTDAPDARGLAFWFPPKRQSFARDIETYKLLRFDRETGWSAYLHRFL